MSVGGQLSKAKREIDKLRLTSVDFNTVVNAMTNHMRNQWARSGYPGLQDKEPGGPAGFIPATKLLHYLKERKKT